MSEHRHLLKSARTISTFTILSRIFGYIRDSRVAFLLGTGNAADAFTIAYRIPNLLRRVVGEGAVNAAFIPIFSGYLSEGKREEAWEFANTLLAAATVLVVGLTVAGILCSPLLVRVLASGFVGTPGKLELTALLIRIMFPYIAFLSIAALATGVLNSLHRFAAPAFAPVLLNLSTVGFSFMSGYFPSPAIALAVGVVVGGVLQLAIQVPVLIQSGWRFRLIWNLAHTGVRTMGRLMLPLLFGMGIVQINVFIDLQFASRMGEGSVASVNLADRVMELVLGGYTVALATAILPLLSRQAATGRMDEMKRTLNLATRLILFITIPATVGLMLLRRQIIEVLFQHGNFDFRWFHGTDVASIVVFRCRSHDDLDGEDHRACVLRSAGYAHACDCRVHVDVPELRSESSVHGTASKWRAAAGDVSGSSVRFHRVDDNFSSPLRLV